MSIIAGYLLPHAPVFIEKVGGPQTNRIQKTIDAYKEVALEIKSLSPDLIVMISPHGPIFSDAIAIYDLNEYYGDMKQFGEYTLQFHAQKDSEFISRVIEKSSQANGYFYPLTEKQFKKFQHLPKLDHGITVPYYFIKEVLKEVPIVPMSYGTLSYIELMKNGEIIQAVAEESNKRVVVIASGDMSHALKNDGPYAFHEDGPWFDDLIKACINDERPFDIFKASPEKIENAAECGLRSYAIMMGALNQRTLKSKVFSYEGPFGVGYLVAGFIVKQQSTFDSIKAIEEALYNALQIEDASAHAFARIAKAVIHNYVNVHNKPAVTVEKDLVKINGHAFEIDQNVRRKLFENHGVFVSIKKYGMLRGCIGTIIPTQENTLEEIIQNAISACSRDYRFDPISSNELSHLTVSVDVLSKLEVVEDIESLTPKTHGVVVHSKGKMGVLLPDLEGINTTSEQLKIASNKGGFSVDEIEQIECFTVERYR
ncbi:MAG TPA: AMMECR1 domain-containing protein [Clostridiales bacterium]|jgi:AmmeMemoRadiSam system protein A|nr:AMMECR1 domain-containing protein [Clostridiales bacterium]